MSELKEALSLLHLIEQSRIPLSPISCEEGALFFSFFPPEEHFDIDPVMIPILRPLKKKKPVNPQIGHSCSHPPAPSCRDNTSDLTIHES